jgi:hypothetical protein
VLRTFRCRKYQAAKAMDRIGVRGRHTGRRAGVSTAQASTRKYDEVSQLSSNPEFRKALADQAAHVCESLVVPGDQRDSGASLGLLTSRWTLDDDVVGWSGSQVVDRLF